MFFVISPTNISVLSSDSVEGKVRKLTLALSAAPDLEIVCVDSAERFDDNKAYLQERINIEPNPQIKTLLKRMQRFSTRFRRNSPRLDSLYLSQGAKA